MNFLLLFLGLILTIGSTFFYAIIVKRIALKYSLVDHPNERSVHKHPIPRIGGIAILLGFLTGAAFLYAFGEIDVSWQVVFGAVSMALLGLVDDIVNLNAKTKLLGQTIIASVVVCSGLYFDISLLDDFPNWFLMALTLFWIIGITNAVNLMDGLDGLVAGLSVIMISVVTFIFSIIGVQIDTGMFVVFVGALFGFLILNSHPAQIFMGDSGSLMIGFLIATYTLPSITTSTFNFAFVIPLFALSLPIIDTSFAIIRRLLSGQKIFSADKNHIHHRVLRKFSCQRKAVHVLYLINIIIGVALLVIFWIISFVGTINN